MSHFGTVLFVSKKKYFIENASIRYTFEKMLVFIKQMHLV
ncbi:hypothetical protein FEM08_35100 [Flavobacterium gilvum]|nr:hypothetical protein FEM08_35100 [Flavobacterium gilvum]